MLYNKMYCDDFDAKIFVYTLYNVCALLYTMYMYMYCMYMYYNVQYTCLVSVVHFTPL